MADQQTENRTNNKNFIYAVAKVPLVGDRHAQFRREQVPLEDVIRGMELEQKLFLGRRSSAAGLGIVSHSLNVATNDSPALLATTMLMVLQAAGHLHGRRCSASSPPVAEGRLAPEADASHAKWLQMRQQWIEGASPGRRRSAPDTRCV